MRKVFTMSNFPRTVLAVGLFTFLNVPGAPAQSAVEKKLDEIEKQIQALKQVVEDLRPVPSAGATRRAEPDLPLPGDAPSTNQVTSSAGRRTNTNDPIARIREEGLNRSQVMPTLSYLTDVIGPRLTGSPNLKRANEWTRDKLSSWGLTNAQLEAWGPFGRGWSLKRFSAQIIEPYAFPLIGYPKAWSPGFDEGLVAEVVYLDAKTEADLEKYKGKLKGAIVLMSPPREVKARFEPLATRLAETNLLRLANASPPQTPATGRGRVGGNFGRRGGPAANSSPDPPAPADPARSESESGSGPGPGRRGGPGAGRT